MEQLQDASCAEEPLRYIRETDVFLSRLQIAVVLVVLFSGCASTVTNLEKHLDADAFNLALDDARGDAHMEAYLASLIIAREAQRDFRFASPLVSFLAAHGRIGKHVLKQMASSTGPVARMAWIALHRSFVPSAKKLDDLFNGPASDVRAAAAGAWFRDLTKERLIKLAVDKDPDVRRYAILGLGMLPCNTEAAAVLKDTLRLDPDAQVRSAAARSGPKLGSDAIDALRSALHDSNQGVIHSAILGLSKINSIDAKAILTDLLSGPMEPVTVLAAAALSGLNDQNGQARFKEALKHKRPAIRAAALTNLGYSGIKDIRKIKLDFLLDDSPDIILQAAYMLLKDPAAVDTVTNALKKVMESQSTRIDEARDLLVLLNDSEAIRAVKEALKEETTKNIVTILSRISGSTTLKPVFLKLLADKQNYVRVAAAKAYLYLEPERLTP